MKGFTVQGVIFYTTPAPLIEEQEQRVRYIVTNLIFTLFLFEIFYNDFIIRVFLLLHHKLL